MVSRNIFLLLHKCQGQARPGSCSAKSASVYFVLCILSSYISYKKYYVQLYWCVGINIRSKLGKIVSSSSHIFESTLDEKMAWAILLLLSLLSLSSANEWDYSKHSSTDLFNLLLFTLRVELYRHKLDCWLCWLWWAVTVPYRPWCRHSRTGRL